MSISNFLENKILDQVLKNTAFSVTGVYVSLHNGDPGETGLYETTTGTPARQGISFNTAASGTGTSSTAVSFASMYSGTVTHIGLWDTDTWAGGGNFLWGGALTSSKNVNAGDTFQITAGNLIVSLD